MAGQGRGGAVPAINGGVIAATTWIDGMTDVLQVMLLLATLIWTVVKIAQASPLKRGVLAPFPSVVYNIKSLALY